MRFLTALSAAFRRGQRALHAQRIGAPKIADRGDFRIVSF